MASGNRNLEVTCMRQSGLELQSKVKEACKMYQFGMQIVILASCTQIFAAFVSSFATKPLVLRQCAS